MLLLITPPIQVKDEATILRQIALFDTCIIHVRKPNFSIEQMKKWLEQFPSEATQKMMLHQHHQLQNEFNLKGIHFKESHKNSGRSEEHTSELQSRENLVCRLLLEKKKRN